MAQHTPHGPADSGPAGSAWTQPGPAGPGLRVVDRVLQLRAAGLDWASVTLRLAPRTSAAELFHRCARSSTSPPNERAQLHWTCRHCHQLVIDYGPALPATGHAAGCPGTGG